MYVFINIYFIHFGVHTCNCLCALNLSIPYNDYSRNSACATKLDIYNVYFTDLQRHFRCCGRNV